MPHDPSDNRSAENYHQIESPSNTGAERREISECLRECVAPVTSAAQREARHYDALMSPVKMRRTARSHR